MTILLILVCCSKRYEWPHQKGRTLLRSQDYYHSGVRWRPGVGGWPIQNTTEWAAAAAPKTVAKAITNNYKSPTDWILFEIKVAPTEYYLFTWSAGCWASGGPPACCPPPSPRRGSLFHITTSPINSFSEISRNTIVFFSVYSCEAASLSTALLRLSPVPCPELSPHSAFQHRNNPFLILQLKLAVKWAMQPRLRTCSYRPHNPSQALGPKVSVPIARNSKPQSSDLGSRLTHGSGSAMSAAGRQQTRARPRVESRGGAW